MRISLLTALVGSAIAACCSSSDSSGCSEAPAVEACVCGFDPYCCSTGGKWDDQCAGEVISGGCDHHCPSQPVDGCMSHYIDTMTWFGNSAIHPYQSTTAGSEVCEDFAGVKFCVGYTVVYHATPLLNEQGEQVGTISQSGTIVGTNPVRIGNAGTIDFANHDEIFYSDFADVSEPHGDPSHPDDQIEAAITGGVRGYRGASGYIDFNDEAKPGMTEVLSCLMVE